MKALKEKRVSLRSVFRRGLVILSLFALAFASCGDSGSGSNGETDPSNGGTGPTNPPITPARFVERIEVRKHPTMYSFEAADPDLSGLQVAVYWNEGGATSLEIVDVEKMETEKSNRFYVLPPVAFVDNPGTNNTALSTQGTYKLYYKDASTVLGVDLYIPAVRALDTAMTSTSTSIGLTGSIPAVYEDQPIDTSTVHLTANYVGIPAGFGKKDAAGALLATNNTPSAGTFTTSRLDPSQGGTFATARRTYEDYTWDGAEPGIVNVPVSSSTIVWELTRDSTKPATKSLLEYRPNNAFKNGTTNSVGTLAGDKYKADVKYFYYVEKLEYRSGVENLRPFIADEEEINGPIDWVVELTNANIRFNVIYYTGEDQELPEASREIGMSEYVKAMYEPNPNGRNIGGTTGTPPRATYPEVRGYDGNLPLYGGGGSGVVDNGTYPEQNTYRVPGWPSTGPLATWAANKGKYELNSVLGAAVQDYIEDAVLQCLYYYPGIVGNLGKGYYDITDGQGTRPVSGLAWPNAASIPLNGKIYQYDSMETVRKKNTDSLGNPQFYFKTGTIDSLQTSLMTRWDVVYVYVDPNDGSRTIKSKPVAWRPAWKTGDSATGRYSTASNWANTGDPSDTEEVDITFDQPWSDFGQDEVTFEYDVISEP